MDELRGAVALLTGASRGIGPVVAEALAREGTHLALVARDGPALEALASRLRARGARAVALPADLGVAGARAAVVARAEEALGPIALLVNGAAIESGGPFGGLDLATVAATVEVNLVAPMHLTALVLPGMLRRGRGHVVNVASLGGKEGVPFEAVYCGTKAGLVEWTAALRCELRGSGVSLSAICPGFVTGEGMFARSGIPPPALLGSCTPEEVAAAVVRAVRRDAAEIIVNSLPVKPLLALGALSSRAGAWILDRLGIFDFQRRRLGGATPSGPAGRSPDEADGPPARAAGGLR